MVKKPSPQSGSSDLDDDDNGNEGGRTVRKLDPMVRALLGHLPQAKSVWPPAERQKWLQLLSDTFGVIYKDADPPVIAKPGQPSGTTTQHPPGTVSPPGQR